MTTSFFTSHETKNTSSRKWDTNKKSVVKHNRLSSTLDRLAKSSTVSGGYSLPDASGFGKSK